MLTDTYSVYACSSSCRNEGVETNEFAEQGCGMLFVIQVMIVLFVCKISLYFFLS